MKSSDLNPMRNDIMEKKKQYFFEGYADVKLYDSRVVIVGDGRAGCIFFYGIK